MQSCPLVVCGAQVFCCVVAGAFIFPSRWLAGGPVEHHITVTKPQTALYCSNVDGLLALKKPALSKNKSKYLHGRELYEKNGDPMWYVRIWGVYFITSG